MSQNRRKTILSALFCALTFFGFSGCTVASEPEPVCGGVTDRTDHNAPKVIASKEISGFHAAFYLVGEWFPGGKDQRYVFEVKPDDHGMAMASAPDFGILFPADKELLRKLQDIIDEQNLVEQNGKYRVTAGLPPEFQPCNLDVTYASGEALTFTHNNDPHAEWAKKTYLAFANWFASRGDASLLPPQYDRKAERISLQLDENGTILRYYACHVGEEDAIDGDQFLLVKWVYDTESEGDISHAYVRFPEDYAERINEILSKHDIRTFDPRSALYCMGRQRPKKSDSEHETLQLHIRCADGRQWNIDTSESSDLEVLKPLFTELMAYYDSLFEGK